LDHRIVELAATIPFAMKYNGRESKLAMKRVLQGRAPAHLLEQRKRGFAVPVNAWFRGGSPARLFEDIVLTPGARCAALLDVASVRRLFEAHRSGATDAGHRLWALLMFEQWMRYAERLPGVTPRV
jgi:asparagine synthase (glutamine-hydrolysing)